MENLKLEASHRKDLSKGYAKRIRREGQVTGSVFGQGAESIPISFELKNLTTQIKNSEAGITSLIDLKVKDAPVKSDGIVIVKGFHRDPLSQKIVDVQLQRVNMDKKLRVQVPITILGEAVGTKTGGIFDPQLDSLDISCFPNNIPAHIEVDVTNLEVGENIKVADLKLGDDIEILSDPDTVICSVLPPPMEQEETEEVSDAAEASETPEAAE